MSAPKDTPSSPRPSTPDLMAPKLTPPGQSVTPPDSGQAAAAPPPNPVGYASTPPASRPAGDQGGAYIPPGSNAPHQANNRANNRANNPSNSPTLNPNLLALGVLALLALFVIFTLPALVSDEPEHTSSEEPAPPARPNVTGQQTQEPPAAPSTPAPQPAMPSGNTNNAAQQKAQALLSEVLSLRAQLESQRVDRWAHEEYQQALNRAEEAAQAFTRRKYPQSVVIYQQALTDMQAILSTRESRFKDYLAQGELALGEAQSMADADLARQHFTTALSMNPDSTEAETGLKKAEDLKQAFRLLETGNTLRDQGEMEAALEKIQQAHQLAPQAQSIELAYQGLKQELDDAHFQQALAEANQSIQAGHLSDARQAVNRAAAIEPQSPQIADLRQRIAERSQSAQIRALRQKAQQAMGQEDWDRAKEQYRKALALDPNLSFAKLGLAQAEERAQAMQDLQTYLSRPMRLSSNPVMNHAKLLLEQIKDMQAKAPRLQAKAKELDKLIQRMSVPVTVSLTSDGQTRLLLHRIRRLGTLDQLDLTLRPGEYVISGSRDGYRDVRHTLKIQPGETRVQVDVRCEEPI